jgi:ubiquinone/menaquinone biosynthesis C-methylase UbiE
MEQRKHTEAEFHDKRARDKQHETLDVFEDKYPNKKLYVVTREHRVRMESWMRAHGQGAVALDFCCGEGEGAIKMARAGAKVYGIDISAESLELARDAARELNNPPEFKVMDAENLEFSNNTFDLIYAAGCLHHVDLDRCYAELHRVLKPGGRIMCNEALAHNPVFHLYRKLTPHLRTPWEVPHILRVPDVLRASQYFGRVDIKFHYFTVLLAVPLRKSRMFNLFLTAMEKIDHILLSIPGFRRLAWQCTFELSQPLRK